MSAPENNPETHPEIPSHTGSSNMVDQSIPSTPEKAEDIFAMAIRARNDGASRPVMRAVKAPSRIRPTTKLNGWIRCHEVTYGPLDIFQPKDEGGFSDEPIFVMPDLAEDLRREGIHFENAIKQVWGFLVYTRAKALMLVLIPLPDPETGRHHPATQQKLETLLESRTVWKMLQWNKRTKQFEEFSTDEIMDVPQWPEDLSEAAILRNAFGERNVIKDGNDPVLVRFRGRA